MRGGEERPSNLRLARPFALVVVAGLVVTACSEASNDTDVSIATASTEPPQESMTTTSTTTSTVSVQGPSGELAAGDRWTAGAVTIALAKDALAPGEAIHVEALDVPMPTSGWEVPLGALRVDLGDNELRSPALLEYELPAGRGLGPGDLFSVRWDEALGQWVTVDDVVRVVGTTAIVETTSFSDAGLFGISWLDPSQISQTAGEIFGNRESGPTCSSDGLPVWVNSANFNPDPTEALRVCVESDAQQPDVLTVRIVNNRPFRDQRS